MWLECRFWGTEVDGSNPGIRVMCHLARHLNRIASVDSAVKCVPCGDNLVKGIQCYELFGGIALKNHAFFIHGPNISQICGKFSADGVHHADDLGK